MNLSPLNISLFFFYLVFPINSYAILDHLELEENFYISVFADDLSSPRQMAEGKNGTIYVAERSGQVIALIDSDKNGQADLKIILAKDLKYSTGLSLHDGDYFSQKLTKYGKLKISNNGLLIIV